MADVPLASKQSTQQTRHAFEYGGECQAREQFQSCIRDSTEHREPRCDWIVTGGVTTRGVTFLDDLIPPYLSSFGIERIESCFKRHTTNPNAPLLNSARAAVSSAA
jgi:hypothetical protein